MSRSALELLEMLLRLLLNGFSVAERREPPVEAEAEAEGTGAAEGADADGGAGDESFHDDNESLRRRKKASAARRSGSVPNVMDVSQAPSVAQLHSMAKGEPAARDPAAAPADFAPAAASFAKGKPGAISLDSSLSNAAGRFG